MNAHIKVVHSDTEITYNEGENKWTFTLRGRDRSADSLAKAKEMIDNPVPADKAKPFEKIPAWFFKYGNLPKKIEVTGVAERTYSSLDYVWINDSGKRSKESVGYSIYPSNEKNDALMSQIITKLEESKVLEEAASNLRQELSPLVLPKDE